MIENALAIIKSIDDQNKNLIAELKRLEIEGHAFFQIWHDKYGVYSHWVISDNKELLSKVSIDGWSDDNGYALQVGPEEFEHLPYNHPELVRIEV